MFLKQRCQVFALGYKVTHRDALTWGEDRWIEKGPLGGDLFQMPCQVCVQRVCPKNILKTDRLVV